VGDLSTASFQAKLDFPVGSSPFSVAAADFDGDGRPDLACGNLNDGVSFLRNVSTPGTISFQPKFDFGLDDNALPASVAAGDLDGDGKVDLVVGWRRFGKVTVLRNTSSVGSLSFQRSDIATAGGSPGPNGVALGDLDADGKLDLVVVVNNQEEYSNTPVALTVFRNTSASGNIAFAPGFNLATEIPRSVAIADLDGDGKPDLVVPSRANNVLAVLRNTSAAGELTANSFSPAINFSTASGPLGVVAADFDSDGRTDIALANTSTGTASVFQNSIKSGQTITFGTLPNKTFGDAPFTVSATASSGLPVSFSIVSGPATIAGNTVTITGAGTVTVRASQAGDSNFSAAPNVDQTFTVAKANQTITFGALSEKTLGDAPFGLSASASSGLAVAFSVVSGPATVSGNTVTLTGGGTVTVRASQAGDANYNAAANVDQPFDVKLTLTTSATTGGSVARSPDLTKYSKDATVQLTATPNAGFTFTGWSGDASGTANPLSVTITANKTITANFKALRTLTTAAAGSGSVTRSPDASSYVDGTSVQLTATPSAGSGFSSWSGDASGSSSPITITMDANKSVTANFKLLRTLTTSVTGQGTITRSPDATSYLDGSVAQLTATAASGWQFVEWAGALSGSTTPASLTMDADRQVGATFKQLFTVTTSVSPASSGSVALSPSGGTYLDGTVVQVTASPATLKKFSAWSGDLSGSANPASLTVNGNKSVTAAFLDEVREIRISSPANGATFTAPASITIETALVNFTPVKVEFFEGSNKLGEDTTSPFSFAWTSVGAGSYTVTAKATDASSATLLSSPVGLIVNAAPAITTQPQSQTVVAGATVTFTVVATGTPAPTYQWRKGGTDIAGATSSTLSILNAQPANAADYTVVVSNLAGSVTSSAATLTVHVPPAIVSQPTSQTVVAGQTATFSVTATGTPAPTYQWKKDGTEVSGATSATLSIANAQTANAGDYTVVVSNSAGSVTSVAAKLTVNVPPSITKQPEAKTVVQGANVSFTVEAAGTSPLTYQWRLDGNPLLLDSAKTATLSLSSVQAALRGDYDVVVANVAGSVTSAKAKLTVQVPPEIRIEPQDRIVKAGDSVTFSVVADGDPAPTYQWRKDGVNIANATSASYTRSNVQTSDAGGYSVVVSNAAGSKTSRSATLTVLEPPRITAQPQSKTVNRGSSVTFSVTAEGTAPLTYQWRHQGLDLLNANDRTLTIPSAQPANAGLYTVIVRNPIDSIGITSQQAELVVVIEPSISTPPASKTVPLGANHEFSVTAFGTPPLSYQWYFKPSGSTAAATAITGATGATHLLRNVQLADGGAYHVVVNNAAGSATSAAANLFVLAPPVITAQPQSQTVPAGAEVILSVTADGLPPLSYQWQRNGANLPGATAATLTLGSVQLADGGVYTVIV
ncbi:MAG: hypothetical protein FJ271_32770, partial [Planctomycetes bacterium]|nr:hypothetical protein [Planctomycetota bacterium]